MRQLALKTKVPSAMAVWAEGNDIVDGIRSAILQHLDVVNFEIRKSAFS